MNLPQKCNNPINLMIQKPVGEATDVYRSDPNSKLGYAVFPTPQAGWRAAHRQIRLDQKRGLTLREFIFKFAPPEENDTNAYLEFVLKELRCQPQWALLDISAYALAGVLAQYEGYYNKE